MLSLAVNLLAVTFCSLTVFRNYIAFAVFSCNHLRKSYFRYFTVHLRAFWSLKFAVRDLFQVLIGRAQPGLPAKPAVRPAEDAVRPVQGALPPPRKRRPGLSNSPERRSGTPFSALHTA